MTDDDDSRSWEAVSELLKDSLTQAFRDQAPGPEDTMMLQGFVIISEWIGEDGNRRIDVLHDGESRLWQLLGFLDYASATLKNDMLIQELEE